MFVNLQAVYALRIQKLLIFNPNIVPRSGLNYRSS
ncbi:hypothetical protein Barb7_02222 [Bacteroidales bacterium Barb7]|nr:hypothetical protein Barb7_02222 [Bacteroidales bacterium Barb7]